MSDVPEGLREALISLRPLIASHRDLMFLRGAVETLGIMRTGGVWKFRGVSKAIESIGREMEDEIRRTLEPWADP